MPKKHYIPAGKFKAECLKIMDLVDQTKQTYIITKRRVPVAQIVPISQEVPSLFGCMKESISVQGDIIAPIDEAWDASH